ncbi:hypothetical protein F511_27407 [Dorcoceras hygrometricum]|uniref:Uncharacterized protein n=1 Tax=Dorcoceras hygrometricum TaxID=472368 RepID=A0A2Z7CU93_9LAMI|nr:hypothetical protein F511_27407 [Dorcoceras hygrometricum]
MGIDQLKFQSVQLGYLKILQQGNTDPNNKSRKRKYEVKHQNRSTRPANQLAIHLIRASIPAQCINRGNHRSVIFRPISHHNSVVFRHNQSVDHHSDDSVGPFRHDTSVCRSQRGSISAFRKAPRNLDKTVSFWRDLVVKKSVRNECVVLLKFRSHDKRVAFIRELRGRSDDVNKSAGDRWKALEKIFLSIPILKAESSWNRITKHLISAAAMGFEEIGREFGGFAISASRKPSAVNCKARRICFLRQCDCRAF